MMFNEKELRLSQQRRQQLRREAEQHRLAKESQPRKTRSDNNSPLWTRIWTLFV